MTSQIIYRNVYFQNHYGLQWDLPVCCKDMARNVVALVVILCLCNVRSVNSVNYVTEEYMDPSNTGDVNHLIVNQNNGKVYAGAVNSIYQFSENLAIEKTVTTGPLEDTPNCRPDPERPCGCDDWASGSNCDAFLKKLTPSVNKALLIDYERQRLITCSNLRQGHCETRDLSNISQTDPPIYQSVVNYDLTSPVVMYIAPGLPTKNGLDSKALYIAATYSTIGLYRSIVPLISSRQLDSFEYMHHDVLTDDSALFLRDSTERDTGNFRIIYKTGFSSGLFSYFLAVQPTLIEREMKNVTKIMRVCQDDEVFRSYVEMPLKCSHNGIDYDVLQDADVLRPGSQLAQSLGLSHLEQTHLDDVIFAVFTRHQSSQPAEVPQSALCLYDMRTVRQKFTSAVQNCFNGMGNTGPAHFKPIGPCLSQTIIVDDDYCGSQDVNYPISGSEPRDSIVAEAAVVFPETAVTGVVMTTSTQDFTVAFVGTAAGELKKVVVESQTRAINYETVPVNPGVPVNPDLAMDRSHTHVYVVTGKKVSKLKVQECGQYTTCATCLEANDPYCGWCSLENRCTLKSRCPKHDQPLQWLDYVGKQCTKILTIWPSQVPMLKAGDINSQKLRLEVQNLPSPVEGNYECGFTSESVGMTPRYTPATHVGTVPLSGNSTLHCHTPAYNLLPPIPTFYVIVSTSMQGQPTYTNKSLDHIDLMLSIRMDGKDFVSKEFTFFDCSRHDSCSECTMSAFPCTWCVREHKCTHDSTSCNNDLVTGQNLPGPSDKPGPEYCPRIENSFTEILVPNQEEKRVQVQALNLQMPWQKNFRCVFDGMEGRPEQEVGAVLDPVTNTITCETFRFHYTSNTEYLKIPFRIIWGSRNRNVIDNPDNIQVVVYKCERMASDCGSCLTQRDSYQCGWCSGGVASGTCSIRRHCAAPHSWLNDTNICPNPQIEKIEPHYGPHEGGTRLTITGKNLGIIFDDVQSGVTIGNVQCRPLEDAYVPASRIVCETEPSGEVMSEAVEVVIKQSLTTHSRTHFNFVNPMIRDFHPRRGPLSGGTRLTIHGQFLNVGSHISASVMGNPCTIINATQFEALCYTPASDVLGEGEVSMQLDHALVKVGHTRLQYEYLADPVVTAVTPKKTIPWGGTTVEVEGSMFDIIMAPKIVLHYQRRRFVNNCTVHSSSSMACSTPSIPSLDNTLIHPAEPLSLSFGFLLDNVTEVLNLTREHGDDFAMQVYPNPNFDVFEDHVKAFQRDSDYLTIDGENLNLALTENDIHVLIGEQPCNVTSISPTQLNCAMPNAKHGTNDMEVVIHVGNKTVPVGQLHFGSPSQRAGILEWPTLPILVVIGVTVLLFIAIIIVGLIKYRRQARESDRVQKRMQNQMDALEAKVAKECKEAFAELQTEMTDIARDLSGHVGIPFRNYREFMMKMLFPNVNQEEHPVIRNRYDIQDDCNMHDAMERGIGRVQHDDGLPHLKDDYSQQEDWERGLGEFNKLVGNRTFLLLFIRTLEAQRDFTMRDRVNVASLISVALQNRMEFHTDILKTLLQDLIERSVQSEKDARLLLRRTESVAEKMMANWFTILLHKFLTERAGEPLFMLFRAIKKQIDKGPVDFLTSEARYSLSEDKLIRQQVDYNVLTLRVMDMKSDTETMVKVLDCDCISQVKEKILDAVYKNAPFSNRPNIDSLELEWQTGVKGRIILKDEDRSTRPEQPGGWKKLNTLKHYNVTEGALVALVEKKSSMFNLSTLSHSGSNHHFPQHFSNSPSLGRSMSPESRVIEMENDKEKSTQYHLVKPTETEDPKEGNSKMVSEIYLTRLLATKVSLQQFVSDLFKVLFHVDSSGGPVSPESSGGGGGGTVFELPEPNKSLPLAIKYMFDFLDDQALLHNLTDPEIVHTWKSNSLPLRFWMNVVKNPDFVFDIHKSNTVDACLSVVAQTLMDSCSMSEIRLTKDSPSAKLLYAKDIPPYKHWVASYYQQIKQMPAISDQDMNAMLAEESRQHASDFNLNGALSELYQYVVKYNNKIMESLEEDEFARMYRVAQKLDQVHHLMETKV